MKINVEIFKGIKNVGRSKKADIKLFNYASNLYSLLEDEGIIANMDHTALLGSLTKLTKENYSRLDYIMMQLYMYGFVMDNLNTELNPSFNTRVNYDAFSNSEIKMNYDRLSVKPTVADILQILTLVYNIGHFKNTFTSSLAMINTLNSNEDLLDDFISNFEFENHKQIASNIILSNNYHRFHLLNSLLILLNMDRNIFVIQLAINVLTEYLQPENQQSERLQDTFRLFREIREICFVTLDLSIAPVPLHLDIHNDYHLKVLLTEMLSDYNDNRQIRNLFKGLNKLLQETVYNESANTINQFDIARRMTNNLIKTEIGQIAIKDNYLLFVTNLDNKNYNIFNRSYFNQNDFDIDNILRISFNEEKLSIVKELVTKLNRKNFVKSAWYFRKNDNKVTMVVSIKNSCPSKQSTAFIVMRIILNKINDLTYNYPKNYFHLQTLVTTNFFLYYLLGENKIILEGKVDKDTCVLLDRGSKARLKSLRTLEKENKSCANVDELHEISVLTDILSNENKNDLGLTISSSIIVIDKTNNRDIAEFDGMIIFPNRDSAQIIFVESKNIKRKPSHSIKCLRERLDYLGIKHNEKIENIGFNAKHLYSIRDSVL